MFIIIHDVDLHDDYVGTFETEQAANDYAKGKGWTAYKIAPLQKP